MSVAAFMALRTDRGPSRRKKSRESFAMRRSRRRKKKRGTLRRNKRKRVRA